MIQPEHPFLERALECLAGAESEFMSERYNNAANRAYYAVFHAAIVALQRAGIRPSGNDWGHDFVPSQFDGVLINRRHLYPAALRGVLIHNFDVRLRADYDENNPVTETEARRALGRGHVFVNAVTLEVGGSR